MRNRALPALLAMVALACLANVPRANAQYQPAGADTVAKSTSVLNEFMTLPNQNIPRSMLQKAQGIVIVPNMIKAGFVIGGRRGKGVAVVRDQNGAWLPPTFVTMTGGSVGFQAGIQSTDVVLVFNTRKSINNLMNGKLTLGVDAAASAGPVGRQASAATDARLQAEIYSYSRSRGLFAGAAIDGSVIQMNMAETQAFYGAAGLAADGRPVAANAQMPLAAAQLLAALNTYTGGPVPTTAPAVPPPATPPLIAAAPAAIAPAAVTPAAPIANGVLPPTTPANGTNAVTSPLAPPTTGRPPAGTLAGPATPTGQTLEITRQELAKSATNLGAILDASWRNYLSLPEEIYTGRGIPTKESLQQAMQRFDAIAKEGKYNALLQRQEFQQTYGLLRTYSQHVATVSTPAAGQPSANATPRTGAIR